MDFLGFIQVVIGLVSSYFEKTHLCVAQNDDHLGANSVVTLVKLGKTSLTEKARIFLFKAM